MNTAPTMTPIRTMTTAQAETSERQDRSWVEVCRLTDLEPEWGEAALIDGRQLALFRLWDDRVVATGNADPRTGSAVMARGIVGSRGDCPTVASPLHKESYSLLTGDCFTDPSRSLPIFPVEVVDGIVRVAVSG